MYARLMVTAQFEVIKDENAGQGTDIKREDFRMISGLNNVTASVITYLQDVSVPPPLAVEASHRLTLLFSHSLSLRRFPS